MALAILAIVVTPINEVGKCLFGSLKRQIHYLTSYNTNIENLRKQVSELQQTREKVQVSVDAAQRNLEEPLPDVQKWLEDTMTEEQMRDFDEANINKKCLKGLCPDLGSRLRLSKRAEEMAKTFRTVQEKGNNFSVTGITRPRPSPNVELVRSVENILPRDSLKDDVMKALRDSSIRSIGVHGMGGIGKTTLVEKINNELHGNELFNKVIMVIVSRDPDLGRIQDDIAQRLELKLPASSTNVRANRLFERLEEEEKVLIILDDVWKVLKVDEIGLPGSCKVIVTTRIQDICVQMKLQKIIKVEPLTDDESWVLFKSKVGDVVTLFNLQPIARNIVAKCKGSPLAIAALGSALTSEEEENVWNNALSVLSDPTRSGLEGIMPEVVRTLSFSFERLESPEIKKCFLFCCLFPEDYNIGLRDLRDYGIGERFLKGAVTLDKASDKLLSFVKKLKNCCLLLEGVNKNYVKMHDVVRDVAICIAADEEYGFLVNVGGGLIKFRESEDLKEKKRISYMKNSNDVLRDPLECPLLESLLIRENGRTRIDQESFFEDVKSLQVLDLRGSRLIPSTLPQSISCLTNLKTLHLVLCDVSDKVSLLGGLRKLEILKLCYSIVKTLPEEIGNLANLRSLDLREAKLSFVAPNVISRLSYLEEFYMQNGYKEWDTMTSGGEYNASFKEVASLSRLSSLCIVIRKTTPDLDNVSCSWNNLKGLSIEVINTSGRACYERNHPQGQVMLFEGRVNPLEYYWHWFYKLVSTSAGLNLQLYRCFAIKNVADLVALRDLKHLEDIDVRGCDDIEYLIRIDETNKNSQDSFCTLKKINLWGMMGMKKIYNGPPPSNGFFGQLRILDVYDCPSIKKIFSFEVAQNLQQLEVLEVSNCSSLKKIVGGENEHQVPDRHCGLLPQLKYLELRDLRSLTSFYQGDIPISCPLEKIEVRECSNLKKFPLVPETASHLQTFKAETDWFNELEWAADQSIQANLQRFFTD